METVVLKILVIFVLGMNSWPCAGFPVYDYDRHSLRQAVGASVADMNSRPLSLYLFRAFRGSVKRVNILDRNSSSMDIEFSIRETTCRRDSGKDPTTCGFQRGYYSLTATCRSIVWLSAGQVQDVWVRRCRWSSSSESDSSEEMNFRDLLGHERRNNDPMGIFLDDHRNERFYEESLEGMRQGPPPGNRRFRNQWRE